MLTAKENKELELQDSTKGKSNYYLKKTKPGLAI